VIVISGPGRSGTSFLALLYRELGFDPGGRWDPRVRAGLEARFPAYNRDLAAALGVSPGRRRGPRWVRWLGRQLPESSFTRVKALLTRVRYRRSTVDLMDWSRLDAVAAEFGETLRALGAETVVAKDPRFCWTLHAWLAAGAPVSAVVLALRPLDAMVESRVRAGMLPAIARTWAKNNYAYGIGLVMAAAVEYRVPVEVVRFPDFLDQPRDLYERLPLPEARTWEAFHAAFVKVRDESLVHDRR